MLRTFQTTLVLLSQCPEKRYKFAFAPIEDSDQPAHPPSLISLQLALFW